MRCYKDLQYQMSEDSNLKDNNFFDSDYELDLPAPQSFLCPQRPQLMDIEPDDVQSMDQSPFLCPFSTQFISNVSVDCLHNQHENLSKPLASLSQSKEMLLLEDRDYKTFISTQAHQESDVEEPSTPPSDDEEEEEEEVQVGVEAENGSRNNDDNNAHKKFITILNRCLNKCEKKQLMRKMKLLRKIEKLDSKKGSRYGFICSLINIKELLSLDKLIQVYERYSRYHNKMEEFMGKNEKATELLFEMFPYFTQAFHHMIKGEIEESVEKIYRMQKFKQEKYREQGLKYVLQYSHKIKNLMEQAKLQ